MIRYLSALCCLIFSLPASSQTCRSAEYRSAQLKANPWLLQRMTAVTGGSTSGASNLTNNATIPLITIPVVVHVVYHSDAENISDAQIKSQIEVLNADFEKKNGDTAAIPSYYRSLAANCGFRFGLALQDTNGQATTGILRRYTNVTSFSINDGIKSAAAGGDDGWDRDKYLNIWVGNLTASVLGYSSIVGGPKATDGVVVLYTAFGTTGVAAAPFNRGRTATHEIGHWLDLIHTWGDDSCGNDDVADTPPQQAPDYGDPNGIVLSCANEPYGNLYMDYMDFTDDIGMHLFTYGQRERMRALFVPGGFRYPLMSSTVPVALDDTVVTLADTRGGMAVWPNPATSAVMVSLTDNSCLGGMLEVYDLTGRRVMATRITSLSFPLDVSSLNAGVYFLVANDGIRRRTFKLVKI